MNEKLDLFWILILTLFVDPLLEFLLSLANYLRYFTFAKRVQKKSLCRNHTNHTTHTTPHSPPHHLHHSPAIKSTHTDTHTDTALVTAWGSIYLPKAATSKPVLIMPLHLQKGAHTHRHIHNNPVGVAMTIQWRPLPPYLLPTPQTCTSTPHASPLSIKVWNI